MLRVKCMELETQGQQLRQCERHLRELEGELRRARSMESGAVPESVSNSLRRNLRDLDSQAQMLKRLAEVLDEAAACYSHCEERLVDQSSANLSGFIVSGLERYRFIPVISNYAASMMREEQ